MGAPRSLTMLATLLCLLVCSQAQTQQTQEQSPAPQPTQCPHNKYGEVCNNVGTCSPTTGECSCKRGYSGSNCTENDSKNCPNFCSGHGLCAHIEQQNPEEPTSWQCECDNGYEAEDCHVYRGCDEHNFCSGHGTCHDDSCLCDVGWSGMACDMQLECMRGCSGHGTCTLAKNGTNSAYCECEAAYTGEDCSQYVLPQSCLFGCSSHGVCRFPPYLSEDYPSLTREQCVCDAGFAGPACSIVRNRCGQSCGNGYCVEINGTQNTPHFAPKKFGCECKPGHHGSMCDRHDASILPCQKLDFCSGRGLCTKDDAGNSVCECLQGYEGDACERVNPEQPPCLNSCSGHGKCVLAIGTDLAVSLCKCEAGWEGQDCSVSQCALERADGLGDTLVCSGHGLCELSNVSHRFACVCDTGFIGQICDTQFYPCAPNCTLHGQCLDGECICEPGWSGVSCDIFAVVGNATLSSSESTETANSTIAIRDSSACCPYNCSENGTCDLETCKCVCNADWTGLGCELYAAGDISLIETA